MSVTAMPQRGPSHSIHSATLADVLERILDKGLVIAGDIKIKLVDVELLTIQIRLIVASVEKAREMGMDWWVSNKEFSTQQQNGRPNELAELRSRLAQLEGRLATVPGAVASADAQAMESP